MDLEMPDAALHEKIKKSLNEDDKTKEAYYEALKEWMRQTPHLPDDWEEVGLYNFLRGCNYSMEKAKSKVDLYFTVRSTCPELFANRDVTRPEFRLIVENVQGVIMPGLTKDGRRINILVGKDKTVTSPLAEDALKLVFMAADLRMIMEQTGVAGDVYILDASVVTSNHLAKVTPMLLKKFFSIAIDAYPVKIKEVHVVNVHPLVPLIFKWVKPFLKEKIINRVHFHTDGYETMHKFVQKELLPEEYGGTAGKLQHHHDNVIKSMRSHVDWYKKQESIKADLAKRPGEAPNYDDLFGVDGSFRQLNVD